MQKPLISTPAIEGQVKWFDPARGFGFIVSASGGPDILLHANVLRNFGQNSVAEGTVLSFHIQETDRGIQVTEVVAIHATSGDAQNPEDGPIEDYSDRTIQPARVKWFDKVKGFGFVNVHGDPGDVFVHMDVLRSCGFAELQPGEAISVRLGDSERGALALEVLSWDAALVD
ncbi:MAG: CspA family cold shock protein [Sulfitobacter sp.]|jgi:CspA family cold shock protein